MENGESHPTKKIIDHGTSKPNGHMTNGHVENHDHLKDYGQEQNGGHFDFKDVMQMRTKEVLKEREFFLDMFQLIYQETIVKTPIGIGKGKTHCFLFFVFPSKIWSNRFDNT